MFICRKGGMSSNFYVRKLSRGNVRKVVRKRKS